MVGWVVGSILHGVDPLSYLSFQPVVVAARFLSRYLKGPLPYVRRHITGKNNVLSASLNKTCPSFLPSKILIYFVLRFG